MAAGRGNAQLTFKTCVVSHHHDLKISDVVISANQSFVCPPDFTDWPS